MYLIENVQKMVVRREDLTGGGSKVYLSQIEWRMDKELRRRLRSKFVEE